MHMKRLLRLIKSLKLSLALMVLLVPVIAAGNLVPQRGRVSPDDIIVWQQRYPSFSKIVSAAGLDHVYTSWWFLIVFTVLFLNMTLITWDLIGRTRRKAQGLHRFDPDAAAYFSLGNFRFTDDAWASFEAALRNRRYGIIASEGEIYGRKGWVGIWGGTILHVGLVVLLAGAVVSGLTRFSGYTEMGEGQSFTDTEKSYLQASYGLLFPRHKPGIHIKVQGIWVNDLDKMKVVESALVVMDKGIPAVSKSIRMNEPLSYRGMKVFQSRYAGPALLFAVEGPGSPVPIAGYVNLKASGRAESSMFSLLGTPFQAKATYMPGSDVLEMEVRAREEIIFRGPMKAGQALLAGPWKITLAAINRWSGIIVVYDWAVPIVFASFFLAVAGIAVMGLFDPREIWAKRMKRDGKEVVEILGWGRWRNMFLDEFDEMTEEIKGWKS